jgi:BirA family biotin operon repressor/biotin-[acetyl-CoA-carboxylase] ligase
MRRQVQDEQKLKSLLSRKGIAHGYVFCYDNVPSTMDIAFGLCTDPAADRAVVLAKRQSAGRGRFSRPWYSAEGGLYASILLRDHDFRIPYSMICAHSVFRALRSRGAALLLKWVNDVLWKNGCKVAGVLTEEKGGLAVIGMGVNVNTTLLPADLCATSFLRETGRKLDILELFSTVLSELFPRIERAHAGGVGELLADWEQDAGVKGRRVRLFDGTREIEGIAAGIDRDSGALLIRSGGKLQNIYEGSLEYI